MSFAAHRRASHRGASPCSATHRAVAPRAASQRNVFAKEYDK